MSSPPLPYRPLELKANGVWDPERGTFYPFKRKHQSSASDFEILPAQKGIMYFVHTVTVSAINTANTGGLFPYCSLKGTVYPRDQEYSIIVAYAKPSDGTTADVQIVSGIINVMTHPGTRLLMYKGNNCLNVECTITYAEIPVDAGEV